MADQQIIAEGVEQLAARPKQRIALWRSTLPSAVAESGFLGQHAAELVQLVLATLPEYHDSPSQHAVVAFLRQALSNEAFTKTFAGALVKLPGSKSSPQDCSVLLAWNALVVRQLELPAAKKAVDKLLECQVTYLDRLLLAEVRWGPVQRIMGRLLRRRPQLAQEYAAAAKASGSPGAIKVLLHAQRSCLATPQLLEQLQALRPTLLATFYDKVLSASKPLPPAVGQTYIPLLMTLSEQELKADVLPPLLRSLKRSPEAALPTAALLLQAVQLDIGGMAGDLFGELARLARSSKEPIRQLAADAISAFAGRVGALSSLRDLFVRLQKLLDGSAEGKLRNAYERAGLTAAVGALCPAQSLAAGPRLGSKRQRHAGPGGSGTAEPDPDMAALAEDAADFVAGLCKDEVNEEVKVAATLVIGRWLTRAGALHEAVTKRFADGLKDKDAVKKATLRAYGRALHDNAALQAKAGALAAPLAKVINDGISKPALRADAMAGLLMAACIAPAAADTDALFEKEKIWAAALKQDSPLLSTQAMAKLPEGDAADIPMLCAGLLQRHRHRLQPDAGTTVASLLVACLLHWSAAVRHAAGQAAAMCLDGPPNILAGALIEALLRWEDEGLPEALAADPAVLNEDNGGVSATVLAFRYGEAVAAVAPRSLQRLSARELARLMQAAHHPVITAHRRSSKAVWQVVMSRLGGVGSKLAGSPNQVVEVLFSETGITSSSAQQRQSANLALASAMAEAPHELFPHVEQALRHIIDQAAHASLTHNDVKIFFTPEGVIAIEPDVHAVAMPNGSSAAPNGLDEQAKRPAAPRKTAPAVSIAKGSAASARSGSGMVSAGSGKPGKGGKAARDPIQEAKEAQLAQEAEVRAHVQSVKERLDAGLHALAAVAAGNPDFAAEHMDALKALVLPLLGSPIVGEGSAFTAVCALAKSLPRGLALNANAVACALRLVELSRQPDSELLPEAVPALDPVGMAINALSASVTDTQALPGPSYALCFPILAAVLSTPDHTRLHDMALAVVSLHVSPGRPLPRQETLALLYNVLEIMPAYRQQVEDLLIDVCSGIGAEELPAALQGLTAASDHVRMAALSALEFVPALAQGDCPKDPAQVVLLWLARSDPSEDNAEVATDLWDLAQTQLRPDFLPHLVPYLGHQHSDVRVAAARALSAGVQVFPDTSAAAVESVVGGYAAGMVRRRSGAALGLQALAPHLAGPLLTQALEFLLTQGLADEALIDDGYLTVGDQMMQAGVDIINAHGKAAFQPMLQLFEHYLDRKSVRDEASYDKVREGAIVFLGTLARHLDPADPKVRVSKLLSACDVFRGLDLPLTKVKSIIGTLEEALPTPSHAVQDAVSGCLAPLMSGLAHDKSFIEDLLQRLLRTLVTHPQFAQRRGAAWGIAGIVKGLGIASLKGYGILDAVMAGLNDDKSAIARDGALSAIECFEAKLGKLFEPYVTKVIPRLLALMGDGSADVRKGAVITSRVIMGNLTAHGIKLVLPAILDGISDSAWRSKQGSMQLLGTTAHCAPQQLSVMLPKAVPVLTAALADPHPKVQDAAKKALEEIGSVIRNPEVQKLAKPLLAAIANPNKHSSKALDTLLQTVFVHSVDAPSLALIVPVIQRGLGDRSGDAKKRAARIVGNMCALINDPKDMAPYVPKLMPKLKDALVDPLPEVRATAAKALGSLLKGMGEEYLQDILPYLMQKLKAEGSGVERSGAAQGLAEVLAVLGPRQVEALLPDIMANTKNKSPFVREGHLNLFKFLPLVMPEQFQHHLHEVLPAILDGLADEAEGVRDAALAAGRTFVDLYAQTALPLLLPAVEDGIVNDNWRIRQSSVELLGELLFKVAGTSGKIQTSGDADNDEGISTEMHGLAIIEALGMQRRNEVLARIFMVRSDVGYTVRTAAVHVWKTVVTNTPRTTGEILTTLMDQIIESLGHYSEERQQMAGRCLGELVRKMGDRVLQQIIPILQQGMQAQEASRRQGVCIGLAEVLENITRQQLQEHLSELLPAVQSALCDPDAGVRQAAGGAVSILFRGSSGGAVDSVIPSLLQGLDGSAQQSAQALEGLRVILSVRPQTLNTMVPRLLRPPHTSTNLKALGSLAEVAGPAIHNHLSHIMPVLLKTAGLVPAEKAAGAAARDSTRRVSAAVTEDGVYLLIAELEKALEEPGMCRPAAEAITYYCRNSRIKFEEHWDSLLGDLVPHMAHDDPDALQACWEALAALQSIIPKEIQASYVRTLKEGVDTAKERERRKRRPGPLLLAGFCNPPKALGPLVPIFLQGLLQTTLVDIRRQAAEGLGELVELTSEDALRPFVVMITGPLIRIMSDKTAGDVREAVLGTLGLLIAKASQNLKPFVPQLQTTFSKSLADQNRAVRQVAAANLGQLVRMSPRVDQLATDLSNNARAADASIKEAYLTALQGLYASSGDRLKPEVLSTTGRAVQGMQSAAGGDEALHGSIAACLGQWARHCSREEAAALLQQGPLAAHQSPDWTERLGQALTMAAVAQHAASRIEESGLVEACVRVCSLFLREQQTSLKLASARAASYLILAELQGVLPRGAALSPLVGVLVALLGQEQASEVQRLGLQALRKICTVEPTALEPHYPSLVPSICSLLQDTAGPTKLAAERTLARVLQMDKGPTAAQAFLASGQAGSLAKGYLNESYLRRLGKLPLDDADAEEL